MRKINIIFLCVLILLVDACSPKFQVKYKANDTEECSIFIDFLKTNFFRDKKGRLRTKSFYDEGVRSKGSFDSLMLAPFRRALYGSNSDCDGILRLEDFYAILGKPDFIGVHPVHKYTSCSYLIVGSSYEWQYCPCGKLDLLGFYGYKSKMGYRVAPYCHRLEIKFRSTDYSMFGYDFY